MNKKKEKARSKIYFVRVYSFYVRQRTKSWNFQVTVKCFSPLNKETGMSVDLTLLDQVANSNFKNEISTLPSLALVLEKKAGQLKSRLQAKKIQLVSVHFDESRGFGFHVVDRQMLFVRRDLATDAAGDLFEVVSYLDSDHAVVKLQLKNFKTKITEQITF